jgi:hypothetical protein
MMRTDEHGHAAIRGRDASMLILPSSDPADGSIIIRLQDAVGGFAAGQFDPDQIHAACAAMTAALGVDGMDGELLERLLADAYDAGRAREQWLSEWRGDEPLARGDYIRDVLEEVRHGDGRHRPAGVLFPPEGRERIDRAAVSADIGG